MHKRDLKYNLEKLYAKVIYANEPSLVIILDAVKSIIGIDLNYNHLSLIDWLNDYFDNYQQIEAEKKEYNNFPEAISTYNLEHSLVEKNLDNAQENIYYLSRVSDGIQILEFLLEFSLRNCEKSYCYIWHHLRLILFFDREYMLECLNICVKLIIQDRYVENIYFKEDNNINWSKYLGLQINANELMLLYSIYKTDLIRSENIKKSIFSRILILIGEKSKIESKVTIDKQQLNKGRKWILDYIYDLDKKCLTADLLIFLNNARSCLKVSKDINENKYIWNILNKRIK